MLNKIFYILKPFIPRQIQLSLRRIIVKIQKRKYKHIWPIDPNSNRPPGNWEGWPENKDFALILTHDVELQKGHDQCYNLAQIEIELGFRSVFSFVPERYNVSSELREYLIQNGFEVGVHGLKHDGKLYASRDVFYERAVRINHYLKEWKAVGFRSPAMHHNLEWITNLNIDYDCSTFDTDPFEPQNDGVGTIFPFWFHDKTKEKRYLELPYTLPQDSTLFIVMREKNINIWKQKFDWIAENKGMALLNVHPDYINFSNKKSSYEEYPIHLYIEFLQYVKSNYKDKYLHILPKDMTRFWRC